MGRKSISQTWMLHLLLACALQGIAPDSRDLASSRGLNLLLSVMLADRAPKSLADTGEDAPCVASCCNRADTTESLGKVVSHFDSRLNVERALNPRRVITPFANDDPAVRFRTNFVNPLRC